MKQSNNEGFAFLAGLIVVMIVVILSLAGWYVVNSQHHSNSSAEAGSSGTSPANGTTLSGTVSESPISGPAYPGTCDQNNPCSRPIANHTLEALNDHGKVIATTKTSDQGKYTLSLPAGQYFLILVPKVGISDTHVSVDVKPGANHFDLDVDTGIR